jgi:hypothetical protein
MLRGGRSNNLDTDIEISLLTKTHNLRSHSPIPANLIQIRVQMNIKVEANYQSFVCTRGNKMLRSKGNGANAVQVTRYSFQHKEQQCVELLTLAIVEEEHM